ncbi:tgf-beta receptor [Schistosoma japonicum]|nr:tgf-beta receptor [Schistosoma japonicum]
MNSSQTIKSIKPQLTVDLTKRLSSEESETLINDPIPPSIVNSTFNNTTITSIIKQYTDSIKKFNITGSVLDLCCLNDLENKLNMSSYDWKLFSTLIHHLKQIECNEMISSIKQQPQQQQQQQHNQSYTLPCKHHKLNEIDQLSVLSDIRKDQLLMNTISDTSLTVKSAPVIKHYNDLNNNELKQNEYKNNDNQMNHQDNITLSNNRSLSMIGVNRLNGNIHVPRYNKSTIETSKQYLHCNTTSEQVINNISIPCDKHQSILLHNHNNEMKSYQYHHDNQLYSYRQAKHYKSLEYNENDEFNSNSVYLNKPNEMLHHSVELPIIRSHEVKKIIQPQSSTMHHINTTNDYIGITRKDSTSTSLAGEIGDEVADMSQISNDEEDNDNGSLLSDQKLQRKQIKQSSSTSKHIDTVLYHHECDCKYWYTHEHQPKHHEHYQIEHIQHQSIKLPNHKINSNIQNDQFNSSLDTLSTTTNSTCNDDSSNTSLTNDNASKHSQLDVISINSCDQLTSEYSSDNTANSK